MLSDISQICSDSHQLEKDQKIKEMRERIIELEAASGWEAERAAMEDRFQS